jgi:hypothetical protein
MRMSYPGLHLDGLSLIDFLPCKNPAKNAPVLPIWKDSMETASTSLCRLEKWESRLLEPMEGVEYIGASSYRQ